MKTYPWLVRREFWENRAIWIVPCAIGVALTLAVLFGRVDIAAVAAPDQTRVIGGAALFGYGFIFFAVMTLYSSWYLLDCLYADRKDRSVLFWKSLPISDTATVLAKLFTGLIAIPVVYFIAADVSTLLMAFIVSVRAHSSLGGALWQPDLWLQLQILWVYLIFTTAIWYLPFAGWFLVVSAWAKRAVMLWSVLPPLALYLLERWFVGTHWVGTLLEERTVGYVRAFHEWSDPSAWVQTVIDKDTITTPKSIWSVIAPADFFSSGATWAGLAVGVLFIAAAIQLRLRRTEI